VGGGGVGGGGVGVGGVSCLGLLSGKRYSAGYQLTVIGAASAQARSSAVLGRLGYGD